jgi:hypothetical protein
LCRLLRIKVKLSTPYHAATDGQSENANKELEIFLRAYVNYHQDDWVDWLPSAEFSDNVKESVSTQVAPFEANYGFMPRMSFDWSPPSTAAKSKPAALSRDQAKEVAARMDNIWKDVAQSLQHAQQAQSKAANKHRKDIDYAVGDIVYVSTKNIKTERLARKLE